MNSVVPLKRFYKTVSVASVEDADGSGWQILLDARPLKTPIRAPLIVASRAIADAIAAEWDAQVDKIRPDSMPLFRLLATAIDRVAPRRAEIVEATLKYAETDLLCYQADEPADLVDLQRTRWQPLLDWARDHHGAEFRVTSGIVPVDQTPQAMAALRKSVMGFDTMALTGVSALAGVMGSLVLALALAQRRISAEEAGDLALLDEQYQSDNWGEDEEARARRDHMRTEIIETARFLTLIG